LGDRARLLLADLEPLAVFLCGPRWQTALARRINRSPRLIRRWVAGDRPISVAASQRIIALVRDKHAQQMAQARAFYVGMVGCLSPPISARLMAIGLDQLNFPSIKADATAPVGFPSLEARPA
jgi:hypothetical protein